MTEESQRRSSPRVVKHFNIRYRSMLDSAWRVSTLRDFSETGARFFCDDPYLPGTTLMIELGMPIFQSPIQIAARVAWCKPRVLAKVGMAEHGVQFTAVDSQVSDMIRKAIDRFLSSGKSS